ncbi:MAG: hypothetical protein HYZ27_00965 [Deltaproteobacteria bacterium]|nr:hypothetical protein [Deltaproteobacteria bacterium]
MLEELYLKRNDYAPLFGVRLSGLLGVLAGWLVHPYAAPAVAQHAVLAHWVAAVPESARTLAGFLVALVVYFCLAPVDLLLSYLRRRRSVPASVQSDTETGVTNPHFLYDEDQRPK